MPLTVNERSVSPAESANVGVIYGSASATDFTCAVTDGELRRMDYVSTTTPDGTEVLCQVMTLRRESDLSYDQAMSIGLDAGLDPDQTSFEIDERVSAYVQVVGYRDDRGLLQVPRTPFRAGTAVCHAPEPLIQHTIGFIGSPDHGAFMGMLKGTNLPVNLDVNTMVQKHVSVLAKTGAGKSYCTGVLLEELLKKDVAILIIDAHDEYHSLVSPNIEEKEVDRLLRFGLRPKGFGDKVDLWTTEMNLRQGTGLLKLEGTAMLANEIVDLLGGKLSGAQQGILYQGIKDAANQDPLYTLRDVIDQIHGNKSNSKWNVISALEALDATGLFGDDGVEVDKLVQQGRCSIVSLKGVHPDVQEVVVARLATQLFEARKSTVVPPFLMVVEEAHNYCPERGIGNAVSLGILRTIASEGRKFGMGLCVVSQRPAKIDKNVLSQCNTQIILKVTNPNDLKAIVGSVEGLTTQAADEIARLPVGVALVAGGNLGMPVLVDVRTRQSRHGGASVDIIKGDAAAGVAHKTMTPAPKARRSKARVEAPLDLDTPEPIDDDGMLFADPDVASDDPPPSSEPAAPESPSPTSRTPEAERVEPPSPKAAPAESPGSAPGTKSKRRVRWGERRAKEASQEPVVRETKADELALPAPMPRAAEPASTPEAPPRSEVVEPRDVRIHRVANRVGYVATLKPEETLHLLRKAAARSGVSPERYLEPFARVGRTHCHRDEPDCSPCPLADKCQFKAKVDAKAARDKGSGRVLGRFFGK